MDVMCGRITISLKEMDYNTKRRNIYTPEMK
jgi:hypothetical protein